MSQGRMQNGGIHVVRLMCRPACANRTERWHAPLARRGAGGGVVTALRVRRMQPGFACCVPGPWAAHRLLFLLGPTRGRSAVWKRGVIVVVKWIRMSSATRHIRCHRFAREATARAGGCRMSVADKRPARPPCCPLFLPSKRGVSHSVIPKLSVLGTGYFIYMRYSLIASCEIHAIYMYKTRTVRYDVRYRTGTAPLVPRYR